MSRNLLLSVGLVLGCLTANLGGAGAQLCAWPAAAWTCCQAGPALPAPTGSEKAGPVRKKGKVKLDVHYEPTPHDIVLRMLQLAKVKKGELVYDLGCGDGRIVIAAARRFGARGVGVDLDPRRVKESRRNVQRSGVGDLVKIYQKDLFTVDLRKADVVTLFLWADINERLLPQLRKLRPGARVVSHHWPIKGVKPVRRLHVRGKDGDVYHLYLFIAPLK
jgi:SAM-dependent methyltransferase